MEPIQGLRIREMTDIDMAAMIEIDKKITGKDRISSWPQKVSSHFKTYYPPLSFVGEVEGRVVGFIIGVVMGAEYSLPLSGWINIIGVDPLSGEGHRQDAGEILHRSMPQKGNQSASHGSAE